MRQCRECGRDNAPMLQEAGEREVSLKLSEGRRGKIETVMTYDCADCRRATRKAARTP
jgi:hypothetical protein